MSVIGPESLSSEVSSTTTATSTTATARASSHAPATRKGWAALRRFIKGKSSEGSTMRLNPFDLFKTTALAIVEGTAAGEVFRIEEFEHMRTGAKVSLRRRCENNTTVADVQTAQKEKIDNTGNFHWPAEEVLAHMMMSSELPVLLKGSRPVGAGVPRILELGAGFGLASFCVASAGLAECVASDGNSAVVSNLQDNCNRVLGTHFNSEEEKGDQPQLHKQKLDSSSSSTVVSAKLVRWDDPATYGSLLGEVDAVVGADCLFFEQYHDDLVNLTLAFLMHRPGPSGSEGKRVVQEVVWIAPSRGGSLQRWVTKFRAAALERGAATTSSADDGPASGGQQQTEELSTPSKASDHFLIEVKEHYDDTVTAGHRNAERSNPDYQVDRHLPLLVHITRKG